MIDDIRRENLDALAKERGSVAALAVVLERSESQVSQWINGSINSGTGKQRGMRKESARYIEERCGKPYLWLDTDHRAPTATVGALTVPMFALKCPSCGKVCHKSFIELEVSDTIACASCGAGIVVADYYGTSVLEAILQGFVGAGMSLRKR